MSFAPKLNALSTVRARLTMIAASVMMAVALLVALVAYTHLRDTLRQELDNTLESEWREFQTIFSEGGLDAMKNELTLEQSGLGDTGGFARVYDGHGLDLPSGNLKPWGADAIPKVSVNALREDVPVVDDAQGEHNKIRLRRLHGLLAPGLGVVMAYSMENNHAVLATVRRRFALMFAAITLPILIGAWLLARQTMKGVEAVTETAVLIASGKLDQRVHVVGGGRELVDLAHAFNTMVEHLCKVFREIRETNDNIAHDLRTPITRIRAASEALLLDANTSESTRRAAADVSSECDNLLSVVVTMLDISEMETGVRRLNLEEVDLEALIQDVCELFAPVLNEREIRMSVHGNGPVTVWADCQLLRRAICNVMDNAVKYSNDGGALEIAVHSSMTAAELVLRDSGCGISEQDLPRVFDRFFRADKARSRDGNGLGLGLVKAIVSAHGGAVSVSSKLGEGTTVRIVLSKATPSKT